jgi:DNA-binding transcriptional ArsR family regulator
MEKPAISEIERVSRIFKVLSDVTRLKIVLSLEAIN